MIRLTVLYNAPTDPEAFLSYYEETHVPLAKQLPDLKSFTWGMCLPNPDGSTPPYFLTAELTWDSPEAMGGSLGSAKGGEVTADVGNFATGGVTMVVSEGH